MRGCLLLSGTVNLMRSPDTRWPISHSVVEVYLGWCRGQGFFSAIPGDTARGVASCSIMPLPMCHMLQKEIERKAIPVQTCSDTKISKLHNNRWYGS